ncbi:excitatory amino acid transporter 5 isoform X1 [Phycodurus eques]|uniref:excitatory amino acid transporter 5 isoform X1 n=1 Tax=Phycodurus eques TaxID=693459 RepID=UPI002ACDC344|nr:excitatory amino acid transporter 5 isoform X1 [Phycodurus eques]
MDELLLAGGGEEDARSERSSCAAADGGGMAARLDSVVRAAASRDVRRALRNFAKRNGLLTLSAMAALTGCTLGFVLRGTQLSTQAKIYFSFPGELLMRMLKMLILPLITSSLMSGLSSMESRACCRMGVLTVTYYLWTTFTAVVVGIVLVVIIKPGVGTDMESDRLGGGPVVTSADALLDLIRNMVPSNLIEATFQQVGVSRPLAYLRLPFSRFPFRVQYKTDLAQVLKVPTRTATPNFVYVVPGESDGKGRTVLLELTPAPEVTYKTSPGSSQQMNVLGIVIFSATMGLLLGRMGERGAPLVNVCQCINECVMKIINAAVWYFPFGIIFLVAGKILDMQDPSTLGGKLGWYGITVLAGLFVHGLVLLPLFYFLLTKKNPFTFIRGLLQALVIALATSSSSATLPITMKCLLEKCHVDRQIARFVLPVGATINMDGTALYEAVAAIFIAQVNDYELDFGQLVTISITATAASIGAAGIPQAGLVTMVIVLTSVGLPPNDITLIVAIDWILDRFRTMINVLGDALAAGIIAHLCRKDFPLSGEGKAVPSYGTHERREGERAADVPMTHVHTHKDGDAAHTVYYNICQV